jgi:hypothetical protein
LTPDTENTEKLEEERLDQNVILYMHIIW